MTTGKIHQGNYTAQARVQADQATALEQQNTLAQQTAAQLAGHHPHGRHKGASFAHGAPSSPMRRGPTLRMPLKSAGKRGAAKKASKSTQLDAEFEIEEHHEDRHPVYDFGLEYRDPSVRLRSLEDHPDEQSDNDRKEKNTVDHRFKMATATERSGTLSKESYTVGKAFQRPAELKIPPMQSMSEVVKFLHTCTQTDPSGKSLSLVLRRIGAAVLRNEIKLPIVNKVADARNVLIEIFGAGYKGTDAMPASLRSFHQIFPLWLVNLSKTRTAAQQAVAAARTELQSQALGMG